MKLQRTLSERFAEKWSKDQATGCHLWTGVRFGANKYGGLKVNKRLRGAHRVAWELTHGPVPAGLYVLHKCDVPHCVNVEHLFLGTIQDNHDDMHRKGRYRVQRNEDHHQARLSDGECRSIRRMALAGLASRATLAALYGCSAQHIGKLIRGERRQHPVTG